MTSIYFSFSGDIELRAEHVWPDGDAPENFTAADVKEAMERLGSKGQVLIDWMLIDNVDVEVQVSRPNPEYGNLSLPGMESPKPFVLTNEAVWG